MAGAVTIGGYNGCYAGHLDGTALDRSRQARLDGSAPDERTARTGRVGTRDDQQWAQHLKSPFVFWASLGGLFLVLQLCVYAAWILSDAFRATDVGFDPIPMRSLRGVRVFEVLSVLALVAVIPWFVRGIRRSDRIDHFRLMMLGWLATWWTDPWLNFLRPMFTYNAYMFNRGCWCEFIPFWQNANGDRIAEPLLVVGPAYFYAFPSTVWACLWAMKKTKARWPAVGTAGLALAAFVGVWISLSLLDVFATRILHFDAWPGALRSASLWAGDFYQFPIYELVLFPGMFVACAFLIFFTTEDGESAIERGIRGLSVQSKTVRSSLRVLAFIGFCNVCNLTYTTAMGVHARYADPWPQMPSWLTNEQCGGVTGRACDGDVQE